MKNLLNKTHEWDRRHFLKSMAGSCLAVNFASSTTQAAEQIIQQGGGKAKSVIIIRVLGGLSHVDSFDIKENNKAVIGEYRFYIVMIYIIFKQVF